MNAINELVHNGTMTKIERYGWKMLDEPGRFAMVPKGLIEVDRSYQRGVNETKVIGIASAWSWVAFGVAILAERPDGSLFAIDAMHRVDAAKRRSDIQELPAMIFRVSSVTDEAMGFLRSNTFRKPLTGIEKYKARGTIGDEIVVRMNEILSKHGYNIAEGTSSQRGTLKAVGIVTKLVSQDAEAVDGTFALMATALDHSYAHERVVAGLWTLIARGAIDPTDPRLVSRIRTVGYEGILSAANKAAAYYAKGGQAVWADGISDALNKGLRKPVSTYSRVMDD